MTCARQRPRHGFRVRLTAAHQLRQCLEQNVPGSANRRGRAWHLVFAVVVSWTWVACHGQSLCPPFPNISSIPESELSALISQVPAFGMVMCSPRRAGTNGKDTGLAFVVATYTTKVVWVESSTRRPLAAETKKLARGCRIRLCQVWCWILISLDTVEFQRPGRF